MTHEPPAVYERRMTQPRPEVHYSAGIIRIVKMAEDALAEHDQLFKDLDAKEWQTSYSLRRHHAQVGLVMKSIGKARRRNQRDTSIGQVAGLLHDIGKIEEECILYRKNRRLTPEEKTIVDRHAPNSGSYVLGLKFRVRPEDHAFLDEVFEIVARHHAPYEIQDERLREIAYDLKIADIFVSVQEERRSIQRDRGDTRMGTMGAVEFIECTNICEENERHKENMSFILKSKRTIAWLYGLNLASIDEEFDPNRDA